MAKVTITLEDLDDGQCRCTVKADPAFPGPTAENQMLTPAQRSALEMFDGLIATIKQKEQP